MLIVRGSFVAWAARRTPAALCSSLAVLSVVALSGCTESAVPPVRAETAAVAGPAAATTGAVVADTPTMADTAFAPSAPAVAALPTVSGTLEARARAVLRAELAGPVRELSVRVGERVSKGMVLARLDVPAVAIGVAAARAQLAAQESQLVQVTRERKRAATLVAAGGASQAELDELDARVTATEATVSAARAQLAAATADLSRTTIRAPFAGVVAARAVTQGSVVQAGDELITIVDAAVLELEGAVAITHAAHVRPGARVALRVTGWGDSTFVGRITRVAPAVDPVTRQLRITVELPNTGARIPAGAWAEGTLLADTAATRIGSRRVAVARGG